MAPLDFPDRGKPTQATRLTSDGTQIWVASQILEHHFMLQNVCDFKEAEVKAFSILVDVIKHDQWFEK